MLDTNSPPEKQKTAPQVKKGSEIIPRLGQGREGIKCKKAQTMKNIDELTDKLQEILKISATQNMAKTFSANSITYKIKQIILPEVHGIKKMLDTNSPPEKQKTAPQVKKGSEIKPRLGQGREGIKCKKAQTMKNIDELTDKLQEILKISATQNMAKNRMDFLMHEQYFKTEAITQGTLQNINREILFYPDLIYRPPPKPTENLRSLRIEGKTDVSPRIDLEFKENSPYQEGIISKTY